VLKGIAMTHSVLDHIVADSSIIITDTPHKERERNRHPWPPSILLNVFKVAKGRHSITNTLFAVGTISTLIKTWIKIHSLSTSNYGFVYKL
jgi:hypothetical protein